MSPKDSFKEFEFKYTITISYSAHDHSWLIALIFLVC